MSIKFEIFLVESNIFLISFLQSFTHLNKTGKQKTFEILKKVFMGRDLRAGVSFISVPRTKPVAG